MIYSRNHAFFLKRLSFILIFSLESSTLRKFMESLKIFPVVRLNAFCDSSEKQPQLFKRASDRWRPTDYSKILLFQQNESDEYARATALA